MRDPIDPPMPVPLPSEAELAEARDAIAYMLAQPAPAVPAPGADAADTVGPRRRINWRLAAELLARGLDIEAVASQLGCPAQVIRRNLRRSPRFRRHIETAHEELRLSAQLRFMALGDHAVRHLQRADRLDVRTLQWLGEQVGLGNLRPRRAGELSARLEAMLGGKPKEL